jgi:hypothetical protein
VERRNGGKSGTERLPLLPFLPLFRVPHLDQPPLDRCAILLDEEKDFPQHFKYSLYVSFLCFRQGFSKAVSALQFREKGGVRGATPLKEPTHIVK